METLSVYTYIYINISHTCAKEASSGASIHENYRERERWILINQWQIRVGIRNDRDYKTLAGKYHCVPLPPRIRFDIEERLNLSLSRNKSIVSFHRNDIYSFAANNEKRRPPFCPSIYGDINKAQSIKKQLIWKAIICRISVEVLNINQTRGKGVRASN